MTLQLVASRVVDANHRETLRSPDGDVLAVIDPHNYLKTPGLEYIDAPGVTMAGRIHYPATFLGRDVWVLPSGRGEVPEKIYRRE